MIAFFDIEVSDRTEGGGADVDIVFGFDFSRSTDDAGKVLSCDLGYQNFLGISITAVNGNCNHGRTSKNNCHNDRNSLLIHFHSAGLFSCSAGQA